MPSSVSDIVVPELGIEEPEANTDLCIAEDPDGGRYLAYILRPDTYTDLEPQMDCMGNCITTRESYLRSFLVEQVARNDSASTQYLQL